MTEKELGKLKRPDLLALYVARNREADELKKQLDENRKTLSEAVQLVQRLKDRLDEKDERFERLKRKLDDKDVQIDHLKDRLDRKDGKIVGLTRQLEELTAGRYLKMEGVLSLNDLSERIGLMLRVAQKAADGYLEQVGQTAAGDAGENGADETP